MAFKMKYKKSGFPFKVSPMKQSGGYGGRPGEMAAGSKGRLAQQKVREVQERRDAQGGPKIKSVPLFGSTLGKRVGDEYKMGMADLRIFGGAGKKALRDSGVALEGDHQKRIDKKRKKKKRQIRRGAKFDNYGDRIN